MASSLYLGNETPGFPVASDATDGKDGYRLKLEKVETTLSSFTDMLANISKKYNG